jgi:hypothetical protein
MRLLAAYLVNVGLRLRAAYLAERDRVEAWNDELR